jgi:flagellar hook-length control protein FliK
VVGASLLPFEPAARAETPRRSGASALHPPTCGAFADAMDGALGAERRPDGPSRAARRPEAAKPRETAKPRDPADTSAAAPSRRQANTSRPAAKADRADDAVAEQDAASDGLNASSDGTVAGDPTDTPRAEAGAAGEATDPAADVAAAADATAIDETAGDALAAAVVPTLTDEVDGEAGAMEDDDPLARGRRWAVPTGDPASERSETAPNGVASRAGGSSAPGLKIGHAIQQARAEAGATPGAALAQIAQEVVAAAHADATAGAATSAPVTQAVEASAATPQTASTADAVTAIENALSSVETVAGVEGSGGTGESGSNAPHEQPQPKPQAAGAQTNSSAVAVSGPSDGVRFTVASAAGSAAYASATPRGEEVVLPQIVQSIRLHAVQGTTEARVQLKPEHLGTLNITLKVEHNQVTATIQADVAAVRQWIESHEASLRQALSEQGLQLARLVVHPDGQQASREEQDGERPRRQPRPRSWRDEEQTFEVLV